MQNDEGLLERAERAYLLCWLACGLLANVALSGRWPAVQYRVEATQQWLRSHQRRCDWLERARLSWLAEHVARMNIWLLQTRAGKAELEALLTSGVIDYTRPVFRALLSDCEDMVDARRW